MSEDPKPAAAGKKFRIIYDREGCIGAAACVAVNPETWEIDDDGKANLLVGETETEKKRAVKIKIIDEKDLQVNLEAAQSCLVQVIHVEDVETGERLI